MRKGIGERVGKREAIGFTRNDRHYEELQENCIHGTIYVELTKKFLKLELKQCN